MPGFASLIKFETLSPSAAALHPGTALIFGTQRSSIQCELAPGYGPVDGPVLPACSGSGSGSAAVLMWHAVATLPRKRREL